jgi:hypothetical protein
LFDFKFSTALSRIFVSLKKIRNILWFGVWTLTTIGVLLVLRRIGIMAGFERFLISPRFPFDTGLRQYPVLTIIHIIPGLLFMVLGPFQFREVSNGFRRRSGIVFMAACLIIGVSAIVMPFIVLPLGGVNEAVASVFFAIYFLISLLLAFRALRAGNSVQHHDWLLRVYAVGLAIATVRPIMAMSFVFFGMRPETFLGTAFWMGFSLHTIAAELWIGANRR